MAAVFWLVAHYGVNVIEGDQWDDVTVIRNSYTNLFDWSSLWTQHNENRIFFPNLVVIALSRTTHFNVHAEEYLAVLMLVAATALIILTHKRRSPDTPWLYYCPMAFLMLSFCQYGNMLWGFQMAWYLVLVSMAAAFYLVDRISLTWLAFLGALTAAVNRKLLIAAGPAHLAGRSDPALPPSTSVEVHRALAHRWSGGHSPLRPQFQQ